MSIGVNNSSLGGLSNSLFNLKKNTNTVTVGTSWTDILSFTADEDCIYYVHLCIENVSVSIQGRINNSYTVFGANEQIQNTAYGKARYANAIIPLAKGDNLKVQAAVNGSSAINCGIYMVNGKLK